MEITDELKKQLEEADGREAAVKILAGAGIELSDEELEQITGGKTYDIGIRIFKHTGGPQTAT